MKDKIIKMNGPMRKETEINSSVIQEQGRDFKRRATLSSRTRPLAGSLALFMLRFSEHSNPFEDVSVVLFIVLKSLFV